MRIAVVDGHGGGIGRAIIDKIRAAFGEEIHIIALGTNALATAAMLKAGANEGATGENAVVVNVENVDLIVGSVAILAVNAFLGELTEKMVAAIGKSKAQKVLIPLNKSDITLAGVVNKPLPHYIDDAINIIGSLSGCRKNTEHKTAE